MMTHCCKLLYMRVFLAILWHACYVQAQLTLSVLKDGEPIAIETDIRKYVTVSEGDEIVFRCLSNFDSAGCTVPTLPTALYERFNASSDSSRIDVRSDGQGCSLTLSNLMYFDTGPLVCSDSNSGNAEPTTVNSLYLFVTSGEHLALPVLPYVVKKGQLKYLYCLPTDPVIHVEIGPYQNSVGPPHPAIPTGVPPIGNIFEGYSLTSTGFLPGRSVHNCTMSAVGRPTETSVFHDINEPENPVVHVLVNQYHFVNGETLTMNCSLEATTARLQWLPESLLEDSRFNNWSTVDRKRTPSEVVSVGTLTNLQVSDSGNYTCLYEALSSNKMSSKTVQITVLGNGTLSLRPISQNPLITTAGQDIVVIFTVTAYPMPTIVWRKNAFVVQESDRLVLIHPNAYNVGRFLDHNVTMTIKNVVLGDADNYSITASIPNQNQNALYNFAIVVHVLPSNELTYKYDGVTASFPAADDGVKLYFLPNETVELICKNAGFPAPQITWQYQACEDIRCPQHDNWANPLDTPSSVYYSANSSSTLILNIQTRATAWFQCLSINTAGSSSRAVLLNISAVEDGLGFKGRINGGVVPLVVNDPLVLECYASKFECVKEDVRIMEISPLSTNTHDHTSSDTELVESDLNSYILRLTVESVSLNMDSNEYICQCESIQGSTTSLSVKTYLTPSFNRSVSGEVEMKEGQTSTFTCIPSGRPLPQITWYRNGELIPQSTNEITLSPDRSNLTLQRVTLSEAGTYTCVATTNREQINSTFSLSVRKDVPAPALKPWHIAMIAILLIIFLIIAVLLTLYCTRRHCRKKYIPDGLLLPSKDMINPDIPLDEQTEALPYEVSWEFPQSKLIMGQLLGQGAFGRVLKAEAMGIEPGVAATTVAVKTTRDSSDIEQVKALISELKILIHIGQHLNIVNLMGACTKGVSKGHLMVIVEYCRYGNLRAYLLKHKSHFNPTLKDTTGPEKISVQITGGTEQDDYLNEGPSELHSQEKPVTGKDLMCWSFQIARGMAYLASIDYIHRDLAARNILLSDDNVVKICDFGLAKDIYKYQEYQKKTDGPLPIKWMALESLTHKIFNTQTDVWAFGVTLWELFSVAATPYPAVELDETFIDKLEAGYRMEKPRHAPENIYHIMLQTWHPDADRRPTFDELSDILGDIISDSDRKHYQGLEDPYLETRNSRTDIKLRNGPGRRRGIEDFDSNYLMTSQVAIRPNGSPHNYENTRASTSQKNRNWRDTDGRSDEKLPLQVSIDDETDMPTTMAPSPWQRQPHLKPAADTDSHSQHSVESEGHRPPSYNYVMKNGQQVPTNAHELPPRHSLGASSRHASSGDELDESRPFIETSC